MQNINYLYDRNYNCLFMVLYIFNPDTDLALANGKGNYTPTEGVRQMISDLSILPIWYAQPGSYVLAESSENQDFLEAMSDLFELHIKLLSFSELKSLSDASTMTDPVEVRPWGWNHSFRDKLVRAGIDRHCLPTDAELDNHRHLSQRNVVETMLDLFDGEQGFCGISRNLKDTTSCEQYFHLMKEESGVVFKEPWSSSGKGLLWCRDVFNDRDRNWCQRVIENEGYVTVMPIYNKVQDFAMEFFVGEATVSSLGYSLFYTDKGFYKGNTLLSNEEIVSTLVKYVPKALLDKTLQKVGDFLLQTGYRGCVGVDMMVCHESEGMCIHPCVEINYRATMGYLARVLKDHFLAPEAHGKFMIQHFRAHEELMDFVNFNKKNAPLEIRNSRVRTGFLSLVPVKPDSLNLAYIDVH